jgi:hypothetical protein
VGDTARFDVNVFEIVLIFLNAIDSLSLLAPMSLKFKKFVSFLLSRGSNNKCAGVRTESNVLF